MQNHLNIDTQSSIKVCVVGHTNTGKTSLIRTLLRDDSFGEIDDSAGTTRHVEKTSVYANDKEVLTLFDTPGLEDATALLQEIQLLENKQKQISSVGVLQAFSEHEDQYADFHQEIKVLRQAISSDVLLYIIDVREPLLGKYRDEVEILSKSGKPIVPVFNFIVGNAEGLLRWREQMAQFNLHAALEFDTVAFDFESEKRLYQKLQSLMEPHYATLQSLLDYRMDIWRKLKLAAAHRILHLLVEVACYRQEVSDRRVLSENDVTSMQDFVRKAEQRTLRDLFKIYAFTQVDIDLQQLPVHDDQWELDIFTPQALKAYGLNTGATALKGAAAGAGIDLMVGGLSLGAAAALGAVLGAGWATVRQYQAELKAAWHGNKWLCVDDNTLSLLFLRQQNLLHSLTQRGHASQDKLEVSSNIRQTLPEGWSEFIKSLRLHPAWQQVPLDDSDYQIMEARFVGWLLNEE